MLLTNVQPIIDEARANRRPDMIFASTAEWSLDFGDITLTELVVRARGIMQRTGVSLVKVGQGLAIDGFALADTANSPNIDDKLDSAVDADFVLAHAMVGTGVYEMRDVSATWEVFDPPKIAPVVLRQTLDKWSFRTLKQAERFIREHVERASYADFDIVQVPPEYEAKFLAALDALPSPSSAPASRYDKLVFFLEEELRSRNSKPYITALQIGEKL